LLTRLAKAPAVRGVSVAKLVKLAVEWLRLSGAGVVLPLAPMPGGGSPNAGDAARETERLE
jgi:hypothetical protein